MTARGFISAGRVDASYGYDSAAKKDIFACEECGALVFGNTTRDADSWLVLHRKWHVSMESHVKLSDPVFRENH